MSILQFALLSLAAIFAQDSPEVIEPRYAEIPEAGLEVPVPAHWHFQEEPGLLSLTSNDLRYRIMITVSELQVPDARSQTLVEEISRTIQHPEINLISPCEEINQFLVYSARGIGVQEMEIVEWDMRFIAGGRKSVLLFILGGLPEPRILELLSGLKMTEIEVPEEGEQGEESTEGIE